MSEAPVRELKEKPLQNPVYLKNTQQLLSIPWQIAFANAGKRLNEKIYSTNQGMFVFQKYIPAFISQTVQEYRILRETIYAQGVQNPENSVREILYAVTHQEGTKQTAYKRLDALSPGQKYLFDQEVWYPGRLICEPKNPEGFAVVHHGGSLEKLAGNPVLKSQGITVLPTCQASLFLGAEIARVQHCNNKIIRITKRSLTEFLSLASPAQCTIWEGCSFTMPDDCAALFLLTKLFKKGLAQLRNYQEQPLVKVPPFIFECYIDQKSISLESIRLQ